MEKHSIDRGGGNYSKNTILNALHTSLYRAQCSPLSDHTTKLYSNIDRTEGKYNINRHLPVINDLVRCLINPKTRNASPTIQHLSQVNVRPK